MYTAIRKGMPTTTKSMMMLGHINQRGRPPALLPGACSGIRASGRREGPAGLVSETGCIDIFPTFKLTRPMPEHGSLLASYRSTSWGSMQLTLNPLVGLIEQRFDLGGIVVVRCDVIGQLGTYSSQCNLKRSPRTRE